MNLVLFVRSFVLVLLFSFIFFGYFIAYYYYGSPYSALAISIHFYCTWWFCGELADTLRCLLSVVLGRTDGLSAEVKPWGWQAKRASGLSGGEDPKLVSRLVNIILFMSLHASSYHELESKVHQQVRHRSS